MVNNNLSEFLADVVMTSYYLAEPTKKLGSNLHDVEARCLKIIFTMQPIRIIDLARLMHITKSRATQLVHTLEDQSLIKRHQAKNDHREVLLSVTDNGHRTVLDLRQKYIQLANAIENKIGPEETAELCRILKKIVPLNKLS